MSFFDNDLFHDAIGLFIIQLLLIVLLSHGLNYFLRRVKEPMVVSEIIAGILLGPSAFGKIPNFTKTIFPTSSLASIDLVARIGILLFMFIIGLELDVELFRANIAASLAVSACSIILPFGLGCAISFLLYDKEKTEQGTFASFILFIGVAMSITAFPVLARILQERQLTTTKLGVMALSAAAVGDIAAWVLLALVVTIARSQGPLTVLWTILTGVGFVLFMFLVVGWTIRYCFVKWNLYKSLSPRLMVTLLMCMFASSWMTYEIGIHEIFGAFLFGLVVPREHRIPIRICEKIEDLVILILLPLYFTLSGLRVDITKLSDGELWGICILIILLACAGKVLGALLPSRFIAKLSWRESFTLGVLMNTRGLVELIVLNIGYDLGILSQALYTMMVLMAVFTTMTTGPIVAFLYPKEEMIIQEISSFGNTFRLMMCVKTKKDSEQMLGFVTDWNLLHPREDLFAIYLEDEEERPSRYFDIQPINQIRKRKSMESEREKDRVPNSPRTSEVHEEETEVEDEENIGEALAMLTALAKERKFKIQTKHLISSDKGLQICVWAGKKVPNLIVLGFPHAIQQKQSSGVHASASAGHGHNPSALEVIMLSPSGHVSSRSSPIRQLINHSVVGYVLKNAKRQHVGVLVRPPHFIHDSSNNSSSDNLRRSVLIPFYGKGDNAVIKIAKRITKNNPHVDVTILILPSSQVDVGEVTTMMATKKDRAGSDTRDQAQGSPMKDRTADPTAAAALGGTSTVEDANMSVKNLNSIKTLSLAALSSNPQTQSTDDDATDHPGEDNLAEMMNHLLLKHVQTKRPGIELIDGKAFDTTTTTTTTTGEATTITMEDVRRHSTQLLVNGTPREVPEAVNDTADLQCILKAMADKKYRMVMITIGVGNESLVDWLIETTPTQELLLIRQGEGMESPAAQAVSKKLPNTLEMVTVQ